MTYTNTPHSAILSSLVALLLLNGCGEKPQTMLESAKVYLAKSDSKGAIIQIKNALQSNPEMPEARYLLGRALLDAGDFAAAETELRKALDLKYPQDIVVPQLARSLLAQGKNKTLTDEFATLELGPATAKADFKMSLASAYAMQGNEEQSQAALNAALVATPGYPPALIEQARHMATQRNFDGAMALLDEVIAKAPNSFEAYQLKGDIYLYAKNQTADALAAYRKAIQIKPDFLTGQVSVISVLLRQQDLEQATAQVEQLKKFAPSHPQTTYLEAQLVYQKKDFKLARTLAQQVLKSAPTSIQGLQLAGAVELQLNSLGQAQVYLSKALEAAPRLVLTRRLLVMTYLRAGQTAKALETLQPGLRQQNVDTELLSLAGEAYLQSGDTHTAQAYFTKAAQQAPANGQKQTSLALVHLMTGSVDAGFEALRDIALSDSGTTADMALISAHLSRKEFEQALKAIDGLEAKQPEQPFAAQLRGKTLLLQQNVTAARKSFERALVIDPTYFPAAASLAALDVAVKRPDDARSRFEALLKKDPKNGLALLALAELAASSGATNNEVARLLGNAVAANPSDSTARLLLIDFYLRKRDLKNASSAAQNAVAALPESPTLLDVLGRTQQLSGELNQAIATYNKLASMQPLSPQPYVRLADVYIADKNTDAAIASLRKGLDIAPDFVQAQRALIGLELDRKDLQAALSTARTVQRQRPKEAVGYLLEGDIYASQTDWVNAATAYWSGLKQNDVPELAIKLHKALMASGKSAEANTLSSSWQRAHGSDVTFLFYLGDGAIARKDYGSAEKYYASIAKLQPSNAVAYNNLAWVSAKLGKGNAIAYAEKANILLPNQPAFMDTLSMLLGEKGEFARAQEIQTKVIELQPSNLQFRLNLAKIYLKSGKKDLAKKELDVLNKAGDQFPGQLEVTALLKDL